MNLESSTQTKELADKHIPSSVPASTPAAVVSQSSPKPVRAAPPIPGRPALLPPVVTNTQAIPSRPVPSRPVPSRPVPTRPVPTRPGNTTRPVPARPSPTFRGELDY